MRSSTATLPDRAVRMFHRARSSEQWHGVLIQEPDPAKLATIKDGLDQVLERHGYVHSVRDPGRVYCKDTYSPDALDALQKYLASIQSRSAVVKGSYFYFLGDYWLSKATPK